MQLTIYEKFLEKHKKEARKEAESLYDEECLKDYSPLEFIGTLQISEMYYEDGILYVAGAINVERDEIASIALDIDIPLEVFIEILKDYVNRINRIKTILEAVKK